MPNLTDEQLRIRGAWLQKISDTSTGGVCPCCKRPFVVGEKKVEAMMDKNYQYINALVAALYPTEKAG